MNDKSFDEELAQLWNQGGWTKADLGRHFHVSPRTIGRHLDRIDTDVIGDDDILLVDWDDYLGDEDVGRDVDADSADTAPQFTYAYTTHRGRTIVCRVNLATGDSESITTDSRIDPLDPSSPEREFNRKFFGSDTLIVGSVVADFVRGSVTFESAGQSYSLPDGMVEMIVHRSGDADTQAGVLRMMAFADRLSKNPSPKVFDRLYGYLKMNGITIQDDGSVVCYKRVNSDFMDIHTGTFDNHVGERPSMPRSQVDDDDSAVCSRGLHVCSSDYLPGYSHCRGDRIIKVKVDPADFVSVPADNCGKARTCEYLVLADVSNEFDFVDHDERTEYAYD